MQPEPPRRRRRRGRGGGGAGGGGGGGRRRPLPGAGTAGRELQPADRRRVGRAGQHLRRRRLRQRARREVRQGRQVHQVLGLDAAPAPASSTSSHGIAIDAQGNVYVADDGNKRIQVFDGDGTFKTQFRNVGTPTAICITPRRARSSSTSRTPAIPTAWTTRAIYKVRPRRQRASASSAAAGKLLKEFGTRQLDRLPQRERAARRRADATGACRSSRCDPGSGNESGRSSDKTDRRSGQTGDRAIVRRSRNHLPHQRLPKWPRDAVGWWPVCSTSRPPCLQPAAC